MREPFAALPPRSEWHSLTRQALVFAAWFALCYGGAAALVEHIPWRVDVKLPIDTQLPFWPGAAAWYLTITPMLLLAPFVFRSREGLRPLFNALMLETAVAAVLFLLLPIDDGIVTCCEADVAGVLFRLADFINLHHNNLPSLHVAFACTLAMAYATRATRAGAVALFAWAVVVTMSTLFTRQHFFADVLAGALLGILGWRLTSPRPKS